MLLIVKFHKVACKDEVTSAFMDTILIKDKLKVMASTLMMAMVIYPPAKTGGTSGTCLRFRFEGVAKSEK